MKAVTLAAVLLAVYLAVDSAAAVKEDEETIKEIQQLIKECGPYLTEIGKRFFFNVLEDAMFEDRVVSAGRALLKSDPCRHNEKAAKAMEIVAELHDINGYHVEANLEATKKLVIEPYEAFDLKKTPERCANLIAGFVLRYMRAG